MTAYVISEVEIKDPAAADEYRALAAESIAAYGGRYVVRGALPDAVEGSWDSARRLVVVEFPTMDAARVWYRSPEYATALEFRDRALDRRLLFVDGLPEPS